MVCWKKFLPLGTLKRKRIMKYLQDVHLSLEQFEKDLDSCLTIVSYPDKKNPFYLCEHISAALIVRKVRVYIS